MDAMGPKARNVPMLRKMHLKRFRSFPSAEVELDNPVFLVGRNGSGKSNLADAFDFLAEVMTRPLQAVFDRRGGVAAVGTVHRRTSTSGRSGDLGLMVELENPDQETTWAKYAFELHDRGTSGFEILREQCIVRWRDGSLDWFDRHGEELRSSAGSLDPALEENDLVLPLIGGDRRFRPVRRFLSEMRVYRIEPAVLREMQDPDGGFRLRSDGSNAASVLREIEREVPGDRDSLLDLLEDIVPGLVDVKSKQYGNKLSLEFVQKWTESKQVTFEAFNMSDGTLRILGLLAAVFQPSDPSVLVIEEPEASMHPGALGPILDLLRHASRFMQVIVTTHSPDVLDVGWIEDRHLRLVDWEEGETRVAPISAAAARALVEVPMGAGELLRANALTAADPPSADPRRLGLFE